MVTNILQLINDLVGGPFFNGLAQYGVGRGSVAARVIVSDASPPATLSDTQARDTLKGWLESGTVAPAPAVDEGQLLYFIFPPPSVDIGTEGGYHSGDIYNNSSQSSDLFWTVLSTTAATNFPPARAREFVDYISPTVGHEIVESVTDRDVQSGYNVRVDSQICEIGDLCGDRAANPFYSYRGWTTTQYYSNWDRGCVHGDQPVSLRKFLQAVNVDPRRGLRSLNAPIVNIEYIASRF
ncbi:hypothetical protein [Streptomyces bluensis]|uniref:hypothetical protein n=1 Tax=Streptomyces bluensis TaxID=33897 RepID=UPI0033232CD2